MGSLSDLAENAALNHVFNQVAYGSPVTPYLGFFEGDPTDTGLGGVEPVGNGYVRAPVTFGAPAARAINNSAQVTFAQATGNWQTVQLDHWGAFSLQSGGDFLAHGALQNPIVVVNGNTPTIAIGEIDISFLDLLTKGGNNNMSTYLSHAILNHFFRNIALAVAPTYYGYATAELDDDTTGSTVVEPVGGSYARLLVNVQGAGSPQWRTSTSGVIRNQDILEQVTPTASWGTVVSGFVADALTLGNVLFYDNQLTDQLININDTVRVAVDAFQCAMD